MTDFEFTQVLRDSGYEVSMSEVSTWYYMKNTTFCLTEDKSKDSVSLYLYIGTTDRTVVKPYVCSIKGISQMKATEFKAKVEHISEYAYDLYRILNTHINTLDTLMNNEATLLGLNLS